MSTLPLHTECLTAGSATYGYSAEATDGLSATIVEMNNHVLEENETSLSYGLDRVE